jgi:hypothetical protein
MRDLVLQQPFTVLRENRRYSHRLVYSKPDKPPVWQTHINLRGYQARSGPARSKRRSWSRSLARRPRFQGVYGRDPTPAALRTFSKARLSIRRTLDSKFTAAARPAPTARPPTVRMTRVLSAVAVPLSCLHTRAARDGKRRSASVAKCRRDLRCIRSLPNAGLGGGHALGTGRSAIHAKIKKT